MTDEPLISINNFKQYSLGQLNISQQDFIQYLNMINAADYNPKLNGKGLPYQAKRGGGRIQEPKILTHEEKRKLGPVDRMGNFCTEFGDYFSYTLKIHKKVIEDQNPF